MSSMMYDEASENGTGRVSAAASPSPPDIGPFHPPGPPTSHPDENGNGVFEDHRSDDILRRLPHPPASVHQSRGRVGSTVLARDGSCDSSGSNDASMSCNISNDTFSLPSRSPRVEDEQNSDEPGSSPNEPSAIQGQAELTMALTRENLSKIPLLQPSDIPAPDIRGFEGMCDCLGTLIVHRRETPLIVVIGVGYVGEHLVNVFSRRFNVIGYDISPARAELLSLRFQGNRRVLITSSTSCLRLGTHFLIAVPTLLRPDKTVDSSFLRSALEAVASNARPGSTVVIESSVAVGMTRQLLGPIARSKRFYAGMSPERVDPGRTEPPAYSIPKIVSGLDDIIPGSLYAIRMIYNAVFDTVISVSKPEVAEMTKLYENCQRMVCIAFANEMADACGTHGISSFEVCEAASTKPFGYMPMTPSLGVGGHCIPVNPYYLLSTNDFPLLEAATARMNARPALIAHQSITRLYKRLGWRLGHDPDVEARHSVVTPPDSDSERGAARRLRRETDPAILEALRHFGDGLLGNGDQQAPYGSSTETLGESDESLAARQAVDSPPPLPHLPRVLVVGIGFKAGQSHLVNSPGVALAQSLLASKKVSVKWCDPLVTQLGFAEIPRFDESFWTKSRLEEAFDMIIVAFRQHGLDFGVLQNLHGVDVEMWCP